jgi:hypothetical protein
LLECVSAVYVTSDPLSDLQVVKAMLILMGADVFTGGGGLKFFRISEGPVPASREPACFTYKHQPVSSDRDVIICLFDGKRKHMNGLMGG